MSAGRGHAIPGVEGVYDRHRYDVEKAHALQVLADLIDRILNPPAANVVPLRAGATGDLQSAIFCRSNGFSQ